MANQSQIHHNNKTYLDLIIMEKLNNKWLNKIVLKVSKTPIL